MMRWLPWVGALLLGGSASAQPPAGQSARLFGVHDLSGGSIAHLEGASPDSCDKGWITHLLYLDGGSHAVTPPTGISLIVRLDWSGSESAPADSGVRGSYADRFVETVSRSPDVHVWILGNEPNFTISGGLSPLSAFIEPYIEPFVDNYDRVRDRVHGVSGHENDLVLLPAPSPWSPCFLEGFARIIRGIGDRGVTIDGFAIHPGTRHPSDSQRSDRVNSDARAPGNCEVGYTESFDQYRVFEDFIQVTNDTGHSTKPIFITESAHNTDATDVVNHVDEDRGFFTAMYQRVASWNAANGNRIRALTPYRWERFGDGTGRDHSIRDKVRLEADHRRGATHTWTTPECGASTGCRTDGECTASQLCLDGTCTEASPCPCADGEVCRGDSGVCVPESRGVATITFDPAAPDPGLAVRVDVFATTGYTNIGLEWEGPLGTGGTPEAVYEGVDPGFTWHWDAQVPSAGTYRATFTADPGASTVYGVAYLDVGDVTPPDGGPIGPGSDGGTSGPDGSTPGVDGGPRPGGMVSSGCDCHTTGEGGSSLAPLLLLVLFARRRR
jgi:MYXO-CTERM domain-containing protein